MLYYDTITMRNTNVAPPSENVEADGHVSSGIGIHLTPTKKKRKHKGELTKYLEQHWCKLCNGKRFKSTYVCSLCGETLCHTKSGRMCFSQHVEKSHSVD